MRICYRGLGSRNSKGKQGLAYTKILHAESLVSGRFPSCPTACEVSGYQGIWFTQQCATLLVLPCCKLVFLVTQRRIRSPARRTCRSAQSPQYRGRRPCHEQLRLFPSSRREPLSTSFSRGAFRRGRSAAACPCRGVQVRGRSR